MLGTLGWPTMATQLLKTNPPLSPRYFIAQFIIMTIKLLYLYLDRCFPSCVGVKHHSLHCLLKHHSCFPHIFKSDPPLEVNSWLVSTKMTYLVSWWGAPECTSSFGLYHLGKRRLLRLAFRSGVPCPFGCFTIWITTQNETHKHLHLQSNYPACLFKLC